ncbi:hypothetical protein BaRGS_00019591 [Batillaria attramentaria]|uniref:Uncharacterized protein n=1 Tax=Batillaria attramentaria TaxID=370345 RepID=A0ABD0KQQ6_9CAEN
MCQSIIFVAVLSSALAVPVPVHFSTYQELGTVHAGRVDETSGLAASRLHPGVFYAHNDKGDSSRIFALDAQTGTLLATLEIDNARNYDWEDICVGTCGQGDSGYCIYIGDIGDHGGDGAHNIIYKVREPATITSTSLPLVDTYKFRWNEPDAESLMIDPAGDLYIISKVHGGHALFAKLPASGWGAPHPVDIPASDTARIRLHTDHNDPQGADISPNGQELLVKTEEGVYYYAVPNRDYVNVVGTTDPVRVETYHMRPAGEAVAWSVTGSGFYTLPEGANPTFNFYRKL